LARREAFRVAFLINSEAFTVFAHQRFFVACNLPPQSLFPALLRLQLLRQPIESSNDRCAGIGNSVEWISRLPRQPFLGQVKNQPRLPLWGNMLAMQIGYLASFIAQLQGGTPRNYLTSLHSSAPKQQSSRPRTSSRRAQLGVYYPASYLRLCLSIGSPGPVSSPLRRHYVGSQLTRLLPDAFECSRRLRSFGTLLMSERQKKPDLPNVGTEASNKPPASRRSTSGKSGSPIVPLRRLTFVRFSNCNYLERDCPVIISDIRVINAIQYGRLLVIAKLGELLIGYRRGFLLRR